MEKVIVQKFEIQCAQCNGVREFYTEGGMKRAIKFGTVCQSCAGVNSRKTKEDPHGGNLWPCRECGAVTDWGDRVRKRAARSYGKICKGCKVKRREASAALAKRTKRWVCAECGHEGVYLESYLDQLKKEGKSPHCIECHRRAKDELRPKCAGCGESIKGHNEGEGKRYCNVCRKKNSMRAKFEAHGGKLSCRECKAEMVYTTIAGFRAAYLQGGSLCWECQGKASRKVDEMGRWVGNQKKFCQCGRIMRSKSRCCVECEKRRMKVLYPPKLCIDCGKSINRESERCSKCRMEFTKFQPYTKKCEGCGRDIIIESRDKKDKKFCDYICSARRYTKTLAEWLTDAERAHGVGRYDYSKVIYTTGDQKVEIGCKQGHGWFWQKADNHIKGRGCPKCAAKFSKKEMRLLEHLKKLGYVVEYQKRFTDCRNPETGMILAYDLWIPAINLLVEYDGEQHFKPYVKVRKHVMTLDQYQRLKRRDTVKTKYAEDKGIRLIRVPYTVKDVEKYIEQEIKYG